MSRATRNIVAVNMLTPVDTISVFQLMGNKEYDGVTTDIRISLNSLIVNFEPMTMCLPGRWY